VRPGDLVGRWDADEFLVIAPKVQAATAVELAERLRGTLAQPIYVLGKRIVVTVTIAWCVADGSHDPLHRVMQTLRAVDCAARTAAEPP